MLVKSIERDFFGYTTSLGDDVTRHFNAMTPQFKQSLGDRCLDQVKFKVLGIDASIRFSLYEKSCS